LTFRYILFIYSEKTEVFRPTPKAVEEFPKKLHTYFSNNFEILLHVIREKKKFVSYKIQTSNSLDIEPIIFINLKVYFFLHEAKQTTRHISGRLVLILYETLCCGALVCPSEAAHIFRSDVQVLFLMEGRHLNLHSNLTFNIPRSPTSN